MAFERSRYSVALGQSYGEVGYKYGGSWGPFMNAIARVMRTNPTQVQSRIGGSPSISGSQVFSNVIASWGGSAVLERNSGASGNYWLENNGTTAGPRMTEAQGIIGALTNPFGACVYSHGEQDVNGATSATLAGEIVAGMQRIRDLSRLAIRPASPATVPFFVDLIGPRYAAGEMGEYLLRDAMISSLISQANTFWGVEKYALSLDSTAHPTNDNDGYGRMGAWAGRKVANWLATGAELRGPSISSVTRSGNTVTVNISVPAGESLVTPSQPDFFGLWNAAGKRLPITRHTWSGNTLELEAESPAATFRYPARSDRPHNISSIVRLSAPASPLFVGEHGLPLESTTTKAL